MELIYSENIKNENILRKCSLILYNYWGGNLNNRYNSLLYQSNSYILTSNDLFLGHCKLTPISRGLNNLFGISKCGIITSVIIDPIYHKKGYGSILMKKLEEIALKQGYSYLYLWTNDAKDFYLKIGYQLTERVNEFISALNKLDTSSISKLENMLTKRFLHQNSTNNEDNNNNDDNLNKDVDGVTYYLKKRILDEHPLHKISTLSWKHMITNYLTQNIFSSLNQFNRNSEIICLLNPLKWSPQIGPSCGIQALRYCIDYFQSHFDRFPCQSFERKEEEKIEMENEKEKNNITLLRKAIELKYTNDGEMFDINNLLYLIQSYFELDNYFQLSYDQLFPSLQLPNLKIEINNFSSLSWKEIKAILSSPENLEISNSSLKSGLIILPYDRGAGNSPSLEQGRKAHYGVICGYLEVIHQNTILSHSNSINNQINFKNNNINDYEENNENNEMFDEISTLNDNLKDEYNQELKNMLLKWNIINNELVEQEINLNEFIKNNFNLQEQGNVEDLMIERYLIMIHGMSKNLLICSYESFFQSNQQLFENTHSQYLISSNGPNLCNKCLIFKET